MQTSEYDFAKIIKLLNLYHVKPQPSSKSFKCQPDKIAKKIFSGRNFEIKKKSPAETNGKACSLIKLNNSD